jgi:hypothetical protein
VDQTELPLWEMVFFRIEGEENSSLTPKKSRLPKHPSRLTSKFCGK